ALCWTVSMNNDWRTAVARSNVAIVPSKTGASKGPWSWAMPAPRASSSRAARTAPASMPVGRPAPSDGSEAEAVDESVNRHVRATAARRRARTIRKSYRDRAGAVNRRPPLPPRGRLLSEPSHTHVLVLGPPSRAVRLQRDGAVRLGHLQALVLEHRVAVAPDEDMALLHAQLEWPPLPGLDAWVGRPLQAVQRSRRIVRAFHVVQLHLVARAAAVAGGAAERHAAVVVPRVPHVELQLEVAERLDRPEVAVLVGVQDVAEGLEDRRAAEHAPLREVAR